MTNQTVTLDTKVVALEEEVTLYERDNEDGAPEHYYEAITAGRAALAKAEPTDSYDLAKRADNGGHP